MNRERFSNLELLHLHIYRRTDFNQIIWKGYIHGYTHRIFLIVKRINFMEPIGTILDSNMGNFVSRWYSNLVKTINRRNNRFEWGQFKNNYMVKFCDRFYFIYQIKIKLKFIYSNDSCMINLFHVRIFLDHRVKSRWAMWPVIFFSSYFLFDSRWMRKRRKLDCIFFPTDSFQGPSFWYCWWRFRCFKQKQQKGTSKMLISLKTKIYISIMTMSRHINKKTLHILLKTYAGKILPPLVR